MDPHTVLGVTPASSDAEVIRAYRTLAKRLHPDSMASPTDAVAQMRLINEAYAAVRRIRETTADNKAPDRPRRAPGWWLSQETRRALGPELVSALDEHERVRAVASAAIGGQHDVRLAVTDRRLLWLRNDAIADRVAMVRRADIERVQPRLGRWRKAGRIDVSLRHRRRPLRFGEIEPAALRAVAVAIVELLDKRSK